MPTPKRLLELIDRFEYNLESYKKGQYNETQVRLEYINPLMEELGWDVSNKQGYSEAYKDVIHEDAVKVGGITKAPDYCFRVGGTRKFFLEAKKPSINIREDIHPAYQLRRYAWSAKLPLSILTDFEEFAVYDCRVKPVKTDKASNARLMYLNYSDYKDRWDEIAGIFSRDAILKGSFDKYVESKRVKKGTAEVDTAFLEEIERWRELLARNIALRNPTLSQRELNFSVQRTIDRIIFLRICEDRGVETYGSLMALQNGDRVYKRLFRLFREADDRYNSGLFHFRSERGRSSDIDALTPDLILDDKVLKDILKNLYYPDSPYEFSVLPADILGQVYERFLGKVIRLTPAHRAVIELKPEVRKAGGVYYTPTYIVDYIVKETVGKLLGGKKPGPRGGASKLKILDPACGSGSFLLGAYQYLLDWHRDQYVNDDPVKWASGKNPCIYQKSGDDWRLTTDERKRILLNNIYGVDKDDQAVEVTKLSLLLKVLEGEDEETIQRQLSLFQQRVLPDLGSNIKCGNSLIESNFYDGHQANLFNEEDMYRINAFDWDDEFPDIMKNGGFDAVIGNPPYVRQESLKDSKAYFERCFSVYHGLADLYAYFIEKGVSLLKQDGFFSYIVANKWFRADYGKPLRQWMKQQNIVEVIDFGDLPVFKQATTYPCIIVIQKKAPEPIFRASTIKTLNFTDLEVHVAQNHYEVRQNILDEGGWALIDQKSQDLLDKLGKSGVPLGEYADRRIYYGIKTGLNEGFVIDQATRKKLISEDSRNEEIIKPFLAGRDIKRYMPLVIEKYLILFPRGFTNAKCQDNSRQWDWMQKKYSAITVHLESFKEKAEKRCDKGDYWWELRACDYYGEFEKPKIIYPNICKKPEFSFDENGIYTNQKCFIISLDDKYLLGILNSRVTFFLFASLLPKLRGGFYEPSYVFLKKFPIRNINFNDHADVARHDQIVSLVEQMLKFNKKLAEYKIPHATEMLRRQIESTDRQIDQLVYELYDLTEKEIEIVEAASNKINRS